MKTKPTLLFLHFFGGSGSTWAECAAILAGEGFPCLTPDLRGFGDSRTVGDFSFAANVRDVRAICDSLAGEEVILIGHSMGGKIALAVASERPESVVGLVLVAPSPPTPEPMPDDERMRLLVGLGDRHAAEETLSKITAGPLSVGLRERFLRDSVRVKPAAWREWLEDGTRQDISEEIAPVVVPTLILVGAEDETITRELMGREVVPHCTNCVVETVPDAAHLIPLEQPEPLSKRIAEWWARADAKPRLLSAPPAASDSDLFLHAIKALDDPNLEDVFRIWEEAFPPEEKNPTIFWLQHFARLYHAESATSSRLYELIAIGRKTIAGGDEVVGMALSEVAQTEAGENVGFLRFLAIDQNRRGERIGSRAFDALKDRLLTRLGCSLMVWEVEPADLNDVAKRRYDWYRRMGGRRVLGIDHVLQLPNQPKVPLWVFVISLIERDSQDVYEAVCAALEYEVAMTGPISLEPYP